MRKCFLLFAFLLFFQLAVAQGEIEETLVIQARVQVNNNEVLVDSIQLVYGVPSESEPESAYIVKLLDEELSTIYQSRFYLEEFIPSVSEVLGEEELEDYYENVDTVFEAVLYFPYFEEAELLVIGEDGGELMALIGIKEELCNNDGVCGENENFLGCPKDCPLEESDNYCYPESDGVCDPDCVEGLDLDCGGESATPWSEDWLQEDDFTVSFIFGVVIIIAIVVIAYDLTKRRRMKGGK